MKLVSGALLLLALAGCGPSTNLSASQDLSASGNSWVIRAFDLYTHCGAR